ncbi:MFS transporter [Streptomyces sp. Li-HN-5-11]|uniref:MFS transporter n=1 Tax=Streptomyces sp. Li-HN-5-11 TaxID=3075432 RepID=UPI0028B155FA|nr:MFS transporter [Streptomyces sp. Li-HN-5-11]WNM33625.1 MFS transporter [Streptomyces sp. Li-HN-5-11]
MSTDTRPATGPTTEAQTSRLPVGTLVAGCFAVLLAQIALAMPATLNGLFQEDLHPVGSQLTWISDAFLLPVTVLELTFGVLGDLFGRKRLLVGGGALLVLGEALAAAGNGIHMLWVGQAIAGLGAAALFPTSLAVIAAGTHTARDRARTIAIWAACLSGGGIVAPVLGGVTGNYGSWRWAFIVVTGLAVVSTLLSQFLAQNSSAPAGRSLDIMGQITIGIGLFALLYAVIQGPSDGWTAPPVIIAYVVAAVFIALFVVAELRSDSPLLRLDLFTNRAFAVASFVAVVGMFSYLGTAYATSIRLGPIQHQSPLRGSFAFVLLNVWTFLLLPVIARLLERVSPRWVLGGGLALMAAGDFLAAAMPVHDTALTSLILPIGLVGAGFAFTVSSITATAVNTVPVHYAGMASASTSLLRDFGFTLGPAIIGAIALSRAANEFSAKLATSNLSGDVKGAAAAVLKEGGPLAVNSVPPTSPPGQASSLAFEALGNGYAVGYIVCGVAAVVCCLLSVVALRGDSDKEATAGVSADNR